MLKSYTTVASGASGIQPCQSASISDNLVLQQQTCLCFHASASAFPVRGGGPGVGSHVCMCGSGLRGTCTALASLIARVLTVRLFCAVCVSISSFHKYASAHVFGQDKKGAERLKGNWVTGGRETQRDGRGRGTAHLLC